ncbi:unnamed protein product [Caenorhabditis brenneri]
MRKWRFFPILIKEKIVKHMCIRDIVSFAKCSKKCQKLLTFVPIHLASFLINKSHNGNQRHRLRSNDLISLADFSVLATSRKFYVKQLEVIKHTRKNKDGLKVFIKKLTESQKLLKIRELKMVIGRKHVELITRLLGICDPFYIESIEIHELYSQEIYEELVKTPQWRNSKRVMLNSYGENRRLVMPNVNIDDFLHFETVQLSVETLDINDAVKFIQNFRNASELITFCIRCRDPMQHDLIRHKIETSWIGDWKRSEHLKCGYIMHPTKRDRVFHFECSSFSLQGGWSLLEEFNAIQVIIEGLVARQ